MSGDRIGDAPMQPVRLEIFEGPLDLLLHLVRVNAVDIIDIPIVEVTRQYHEYLDLMQEWNLEVAVEFLLMAATLVQIKSRVLLPVPPGAGAAEDDDPRADLVRRLLEHQEFRAAVSHLRDGELREAGSLGRSDTAVAQFQDEYHIDAGLFELVTAFRRILADTEAGDGAFAVVPEDFPIEEAIGWLQERLPEGGRANLRDLVAALPLRHQKIAVFLALLEMIRTRQVRAFQGETYGEIFLSRPEPAARTAVPEPPRRPAEEPLG